MFFLDGGWEKLFGNIQRRVAMPSRAPKAGDAEQRMRAQEERCHAMGDIRGIVQAVALNHDPSRSIQVKSFGPVTKYVSLLPDLLEPTDPHDFQSRPYSNRVLLFLKRSAPAIPLLHPYHLIGPRPPPSRRRIEFLRQESQVNHSEWYGFSSRSHIAMRECFVRVALTSTPASTCQNLRTAVRKVEVDGGNGRVQRGAGVQNGCATAAADINAKLAKKGNV